MSLQNSRVEYICFYTEIKFEYNLNMGRIDISDLQECLSCKKGIEVFYATPNQEYWFEPGIYGYYDLQPLFINDRAYFRKGNYGIWWDGEGKWTIGFNTNKGSNIGCACIERDAFCLHSIKDMEWELYWGDTGEWEKARKSLVIRLSFARGMSQMDNS